MWPYSHLIKLFNEHILKKLSRYLVATVQQVKLVIDLALFKRVPGAKLYIH